MSRAPSVVDQNKKRYELTIGTGFRDAWCGAYHTQSRLATSKTFAQRLGFDDQLLPFDLLLFVTSSMAHADKADEPLSAAIQEWFAHYDTQFPITGELFAASPNDDTYHSSSIVKVEKRPEMATFHWGAAGGMLGPMPNMTKGD